MIVIAGVGMSVLPAPFASAVISRALRRQYVLSDVFSKGVELIIALSYSSIASLVIYHAAIGTKLHRDTLARLSVM